MKLHKIYLAAMVLMTMALASCKNGDSDESPFDNKVYINTSAKITTMMLKNSIKEDVKMIQAALAKPATKNITLRYEIDSLKVNTYNEAYYDQAVMLPSAYYEMPKSDAVINQGSVRSTDVAVYFKGIDKLSREQVYVLPVTLAYADDMDILRSGRTVYYVLKGGASINVVADMEKTNYISIPSFENEAPSAAVCNNLSKFTLESLIRVRQFAPGIQTVMGIEGYFLIRISDNGLLPNQLQVANSYGSLSNEKCLLTPNEWTHIAVTFDTDAKQILLYINGELVAQNTGIGYMQPCNFGRKEGWPSRPFYIGYSYETSRELDGEISECRIWNTVRTQEEIQSNTYEVDPLTPGLVAYWKFDEGSGETIKDHTGNGNDGKAKSKVKWNAVTLPAPTK